MNASYRSCSRAPGSMDAVAGPLARAQSRDAHLGGDPQEHDQVELRDEDVAPATQRSREHPARVPGQLGPQQALARGPLADVLEWRVARQPEEVVGVQVRAAEPFGQRPPERRRAGAGRAHQVHAEATERGRHCRPPTIPDQNRYAIPTSTWMGRAGVTNGSIGAPARLAFGPNVPNVSYSSLSRLLTVTNAL